MNDWFERKLMFTSPKARAGITEYEDPEGKKEKVGKRWRKGRWKEEKKAEEKGQMEGGKRSQKKRGDVRIFFISFKI